MASSSPNLGEMVMMVMMVMSIVVAKCLVIMLKFGSLLLVVLKKQRSRCGLQFSFAGAGGGGAILGRLLRLTLHKAPTY